MRAHTDTHNTHTHTHTHTRAMGLGVEKRFFQKRIVFKRVKGTDRGSVPDRNRENHIIMMRVIITKLSFVFMMTITVR